MGIKIDPIKDKVYFKNRLITPVQEKIVLAFYKPRGVVSTMQRGQEVGQILSDVLIFQERLFPIGRLDRDSEGLILLTNDGDLALKLGHPRYEHEKEYLVTVDKTISPEQLSRLNRPFRIGGYKTRPALVSKVSDKGIKIILHEGRKRQIRNMCEQTGLQVKKLVRVRIQNIKLDKLKPGNWKLIDPEMIKL